MYLSRLPQHICPDYLSIFVQITWTSGPKILWSGINCVANGTWGVNFVEILQISKAHILIPSPQERWEVKRRRKEEKPGIKRNLFRTNYWNLKFQINKICSAPDRLLLRGPKWSQLRESPDSGNFHESPLLALEITLTFLLAIIPAFNIGSFTLFWKCEKMWNIAGWCRHWAQCFPFWHAPST